MVQWLVQLLARRVGWWMFSLLLRHPFQLWFSIIAWILSHWSCCDGLKWVPRKSTVTSHLIRDFMLRHKVEGVMHNQVGRNCSIRCSLLVLEWVESCYCTCICRQVPWPSHGINILKAWVSIQALISTGMATNSLNWLTHLNLFLIPNLPADKLHIILFFTLAIFFSSFALFIHSIAFILKLCPMFLFVFAVLLNWIACLIQSIHIALLCLWNSMATHKHLTLMRKDVSKLKFDKSLAWCDVEPEPACPSSHYQDERMLFRWKWVSH